MKRQIPWLAITVILFSLGCEETNRPPVYLDGTQTDMDGGPQTDGEPPDSRVDSDGPVVVGDGPEEQGPLFDVRVEGPLEGPPVTCKSRCEVVFTLPDEGENDVILMGDFDRWSTGKVMSKAGSNWTITLDLEHGQPVQYKFAKNNKTEWVNDPKGNTCAELGSNRNSFVMVDCDNACPITTSDDWRDGVLYFVMLDRFNNGDPTNDRKVGDRFGRPVQPIADWMGGDLQGLINKIQEGYFEQLGVNILWISNPIAAADGAWDGSLNELYTGYHGYWPTDMTKVEARFGDRLLLKEMIVEAHKKGLKVIMDYPMNHLHQDSPHYIAHPEWFWDYQFYGQDCKCGTAVCTWEGPQKERCWFDPFLPDFDYSNADALKFSLDNLVMWATDVGGDGSNVAFDGFRMDAVKHIDMTWVTSMRARLDAEFPNHSIWTVGETFTGSKELINAYIGPDKLDGQFDFPLHDEVRGKILKREGTMKNMGDFIQNNRCPYGSESLMSTFLGNHDKQRVIHDSMNEFYAPFDFPAQPTATEPYERLAMGFTLLMTMPGVPL
ncbi:MAG: hypothetical protein JRH20_25415, partial [Deltaproteobacteria bacterium]|nr:hypothetical protein [Deltaproteobacteria bacterium]